MAQNTRLLSVISKLFFLENLPVNTECDISKVIKCEITKTA